MTDKNQRYDHYTALYSTPDELLKRDDLSRDEKIKILCEWEYDARELLVAADENMPGDYADMLSQIHQALHQLGADCNTENTAPTKHGGGIKP
jgi:hypothetical protein